MSSWLTYAAFYFLILQWFYLLFRCSLKANMSVFHSKTCSVAQNFFTSFLEKIKSIRLFICMNWTYKIIKKKSSKNSVKANNSTQNSKRYNLCREFFNLRVENSVFRNHIWVDTVFNLFNRKYFRLSTWIFEKYFKEKYALRHEPAPY